MLRKGSRNHPQNSALTVYCVSFRLYFAEGISMCLVTERRAQKLPQINRDNEKREKLIEATVRIIAEEGLENLRTAEICSISGVNVAHLYHLFENKDDLLAKAFAASDERFLKTILDNFPVLRYQRIEYEMRCRVLFMHCWEHIMNRRMYTVFYVRYYYSSLF